ncbi:hypothetical protein K2Z84_00640 [Candidatus Binatia bacterium]|nr:hypothetical protein [Candidatus Binatia bacterium]
MLRLAVSSALLASMLSAATALAAPDVAVTTCGQVLPARAHGVLASDLDCTGQPVGVVVGRGGKLSLGGFTLASGFNGIECRGSCTVTGPGAINGGQAAVLSDKKVKVSSVTISSAVIYGVDGDIVELEGSTVTGTGYFAVQGRRSARISSSSISGGFGGASVGRAIVEGSTVSAATFGISGGSASVKDGSAIETTSGEPSAYAIRTVKKPHVASDSTCSGRSLRLGSGDSWGVCSLD